MSVEIKEQIENLVRKYYEENHMDALNYKCGDRIQYSGRVYGKFS